MGATDTGIIGWPVAQSLSPVIHGYWRMLHHIEGNYELFAIDPVTMDTDIKKLKARGIRGFNVTVPHKETIGAYLDTVDALAHHIGAVNTVVRDGATWRGTNTDAYGFISHLNASVGALAPYLESVVILGAGGAARAAIAALKEAGAQKILLLNRTKATADALAAEFKIKAGEWDARNELIEGATLLVNTTVLGMKGNPPLEISLAKLVPDAAVYDIVYAPLLTRLLLEAADRGFHAIDGLGMLLYQAQMGFHEWHGVWPQVTDELRALVLAEIKKREAA